MGRRAGDDEADQRGERRSRDDRRDHRSRIGIRRLVGWAALLPVASRAPVYGRLLWELARDQRTPATRKALLAAALGYLVIGRDLVPDEVPLIGGLDDLVVVVLAVDVFLDGVPIELLDEKLDELGIDRRAFDEDLARVRRLMPAPLRRVARRIPGMIAFAGDTLQRIDLGPRLRTWINKEESIA